MSENTKALGSAEQARQASLDAKKEVETLRNNKQRTEENAKNWEERLKRKHEEAEAMIAAAEQAKLNPDLDAADREAEAKVAVDEFFRECHKMISEGVKGYDTLLSTGGQMVTWSVLLADALHSQHQADRKLFNLIGAILTSPMMAVNAAKWAADRDIVYTAGEKMGDLFHRMLPNSKLDVSDLPDIDLNTLIAVGEDGTLTVNPMPKPDGMPSKEYELLNQLVENFVYMSMMKKNYTPKEEGDKIIWSKPLAEGKELQDDKLGKRAEVIATIKAELISNSDDQSLDHVTIQSLADALDNRHAPPRSGLS